jgi:hypothetical protein
MRRALALLFCLPALPSAIVVLSVPPVSRALPAPVLAALQPAAGWLAGLVARLPPGSLGGRVFYGSYAVLAPLAGANALALHAALLGLPWLALAWLLSHRARPLVARRVGRGS